MTVVELKNKLECFDDATTIIFEDIDHQLFMGEVKITFDSQYDCVVVKMD